VAFTWDAVADRGDGAGRDYFVAGMDHYVSWLTSNARSGKLQLAATPSPRVLQLDGMRAGETACVHVQAVDRLQNSTADQVQCAGALAPPPMPGWTPIQPQVEANPQGTGLVGLETWLWLAPSPTEMSIDEHAPGVDYQLTASPIDVEWAFGDGTTASYPGLSGFGRPYPESSPVAHTYQAHSKAGYRVGATVRYAVRWTALVAGRSFGPYGLGSVDVEARPMSYPMLQAQPELLAI
jgi:hypothetical protein